MDNLSEEEKQAIDKINRQILIGKSEKKIGIPVYISDLEIILNLIEKSTQEINLLEEQKKYIEMEYGRTIEEKDKMINLMCEQLSGLAIWNDEKGEETLILGDVEEVKEHFRKKVEEK